MIRMAYEKDEHNLRERDINHKNKQNFDAVLHIMNSSHLLSTIPEAKGTFVRRPGMQFFLQDTGRSGYH